MVDYLKELLAKGEYQRAIDLAESMMRAHDLSLNGVMMVNSILAEARYLMNEFHGTITSGSVAIKIAKELDDRVCLARVSQFVGIAYARLGQPRAAVSTFYEYLAQPYPDRKVTDDIKVWYNIGLAYQVQGDAHEAVEALRKALKLAEISKLDRLAHGIRHALVQPLVLSGRFEEVPAILAKCLSFIRRAEPSEDKAVTRLWHLVIRAKFALLTGRLGRCEAIARKGLSESVKYPQPYYTFNMLLAEVSQKRGETPKALHHYLAARVTAITSRRFDLELEASELMYLLLSSIPNSLGLADLPIHIPDLETSDTPGQRSGKSDQGH